MPWRARPAALRGSSPLARGGLGVLVGRRPDRGLIPARAGRTGARGAAHEGSPAHPRSRGADPACVDLTVPDLGSSPLARGGQDQRKARRSLRRLIPARAGRTATTRPRTVTDSAHPRSRGADVMPSPRSPWLPGSSPLARGGRHRARRTQRRRRLIPARAGRTCHSRPTLLTWTAHPRSRGADRPEQRSSDGSRGSSPLARGGHPLLRRQ